MKQVKCKSGLTGWQDKLQNVYSTFEEFEAANRTFNILERLKIYTSPATAWACNPTIRGSVNPNDLEVVK